MKRAELCLLIIATFITFSPIGSLGQLTVDATGPVRRRVREGTMGRGGSVGRKSPLHVSICVVGGWRDNGKIEVDFTLTNSGRDALTIPISPNPGDLEPADPKATYTVKRLSLYVTSDKRREEILPGRAHLYGSSAFPGTLVTLSPSESVRVLALVGLPRPLGTESDAGSLVAHAALDDETIKAVDGQTLSDIQEIGSSSSQEYTLQSLFKSPEIKPLK
jgi:hypothetical protein